MNLSQDELQLLLSILTQVQLVYKDSVKVNKIIYKLQGLVEPPKPEDVPLVKSEVVS